MRPSELEKLYLLVDLIKDFTGLPQFEWLVEVRNRLQISALDENNRKPIVWFMHNPAIASYKKHKRTTVDNVAADQLVTDVVRHGRNHTQAHGAAEESSPANGRQAIK